MDNLLKDNKLSVKTILKFDLNYLKKEIIPFIFALFLMLINIAFDLILPLIISKVTSVLSASNIKYALVVKFVILYISLSIVNQVVFYLASMTIQKAGQRIIYEVRMEVFSHIENMSQRQFDVMPVGSLVTRVASYTQSMSDLFTNDLIKIFKNIIMVIGVYAIMMVISYKLGFIMLIFIVVLLIVSAIFSIKSSKVFREERRRLSDLNTYLNENLSGVKITQIFNQEERKKEEFKKKNDDLRKASYNISKAFALYRPFVTFLYYLAIATIFYVGIKINLSSASIVAFYLYTSNFFNPIEELADELNTLNKALSASERLINLLNIKPDILDSDDSVDLDKFKGDIEFRNVWFSYKEGEWVLKDLSFKVNAGETVAFVGPTGAGKTTILGLLVRNYEVSKGEILIDGINIKKIKISSLRKNIGQMLQDVFLFNGTIKSNITLHDEEYSDLDINNAIDYVNARGFVESLPDGIEHKVIERGENLSSGERQLISFSRTVLHRPQILTLDEATANIDTQTEMVIQQSLENLKSIGTMLVVAHRLSTIKNASKIMVLEHGNITEIGTHDELLKNKGYYYKLYNIQNKKNDYVK